MLGQISSPCGWCHVLNPTTVRFCQRCGHEAHVARMRCRCPGCAVWPGQLTQTVQCRRCGALIAWVTVATRESLANPLGEEERQALAELLLRLTDEANPRASVCVRCRVTGQTSS